MIVYDAEIRRAIAKDGEPRQGGVEYCKGFQDFNGMGIAVIGVFDYRTETQHVYLSDNLDDFRQRVAEADVVVGFNNGRFDDELMRANNVEIPREKSYDLLREFWVGLGIGTAWKRETHGGYSLTTLAAANIGKSVGKTMDGADAPVRWQKGDKGRVIDYCLQDVMLTKRLLDRVIRAGYLFDPKTAGRKVPIRRP